MKIESRKYGLPLQLQEAGCTLQTGDVSEGTKVQDVRKMRRVLGSRLLLDRSLRMEIMRLLEIKLCDPDTLRHFLLPLVAETQVMDVESAATSPANSIGLTVMPTGSLTSCVLLMMATSMQDGNATGDSLMRILLCTDVIQASVAEQLLVKLADDGMEQNLASLILSQFRWWATLHLGVAIQHHLVASHSGLHLCSRWLCASCLLPEHKPEEALKRLTENT